MSSPSNITARPGSPSNTEIFHSSVHEPEVHSPVDPNAQPRYMKELEEEIHSSRNIHVYVNGEHTHEPHLIHIPLHKLDSMEHILEVISERITFKAGYPAHLYDLDGREIRRPAELENHCHLVVASNLDKHFHDVPYLPVEKPLFQL